MADTLIRIKEVTKTYRKLRVVSPFSTELKAGEVLALCGGNGAGKSTIIKMIAGILKPSGGSIEVDQLSWRKERRAYAERIGYMPDDFRLAYTLTVRDLLTFYAQLRRATAEEVAETLSLVGLDVNKDQPVSQLSKGMRQRFLFAQALLGKPKLLLLDEPTNGLDPSWIQSFSTIIQELKRRGQTVIFSTHQLSVVEQVADQVIFLHEGQVIYSERIEKYLEEYHQHNLEQIISKLYTLS